MTTRTRLIRLTAIVSLLLLCSCAAHTHSSMMQNIRAGIEKGDAENGLSKLEEKVFVDADGDKTKIEEGVDPILLLELGTAYCYLGNFEKSNIVLETAYIIYNGQEERAIISLSETSKHVSEAVLAEGTGDYQLTNYEKIFLHSLKATNYLMLGDESAARVEIQRAYTRQVLIKERSDIQAAAAKEDFDEQATSANLNSSFNKDEVTSKSGLSEVEMAAIQNVRNSYQNAYTEVLSTVVYTLNNELNYSIPPLRRAVQISSNPFIERNKAWREAIQDERGTQRDNFYLFVFAGNAPVKKEQSIIIPNPISKGINKISLARPVAEPSNYGNVELMDQNGMPIETAMELTDIKALAYKDYQEKFPVMMTKAITRLIAQTAKDYVLKETMGDWGVLLGAVTNLAFEGADTRTWTMLPEKVLFLSGDIKETEATVVVKNNSGSEIFRGEVKITPKKNTVVFIRVFDYKANLYYHNF